MRQALATRSRKIVAGEESTVTPGFTLGHHLAKDGTEKDWTAMRRIETRSIDW
jgi:hypothetical protein